MKLTSEQSKYLIFGYALSQADMLISSMFSNEQLSKLNKEQYMNMRINVTNEIISEMREDKQN